MIAPCEWLNSSRRAGELEQELTQTRLQLAALQPRTEPFEQSLPLQRIQADLPSDLTLVSYHIAGDEILAFVITHETTQVVRKISHTGSRARAPASAQCAVESSSCAQQLARTHICPGWSGMHNSHCMGSTANCLAPLDHLLDLNADLPARKLVIIPHGLLHQVPFQALYDGERYLIEMAELSYAPSATVLALCQAATTAPIESAAGVRRLRSGDSGCRSGSSRHCAVASTGRPSS